MTMKQQDKIEIFDTTLRDGTQGMSVNLSIRDKLMISERLDEFGIDIIEGGWPGSNPRDEEFFREVRSLNLAHAKICAFGSTARFPDKVENDANIQALLAAETPIVSIFGKTWRFHSQTSLGLSDEENEDLIRRSVAFLRDHGRRVIFDAEHYFDGYRDNPDFALRMIRAAEDGGAERVVLCETNGGALTQEVSDITLRSAEHLAIPLGIHAHNDSELAVANSLAAVVAGVTQVQGTINGVGERCGNANLCAILPNLHLKMHRDFNAVPQLNTLTHLSNFVWETMNLSPNPRAAFVGKAAFSHKGGIHVSSVLKNSAMYEHIRPELVGNKQHVLVSDLSGQSNIRYKAGELGITLPEGREFSRNFVQKLKAMEYEGLQFDGAEASFELLMQAELGMYAPFFEVVYTKANVLVDEKGNRYAEAVLKVQVGEEIEHTAADGNGPVNALDKALRKAIQRFYPEIRTMQLVDYKVRVLGDNNGTGAKVRVLVESSDGQNTWATVGTSHDIIEASLQAISDSINYKIYRLHLTNRNGNGAS